MRARPRAAGAGIGSNLQVPRPGPRLRPMSGFGNGPFPIRRLTVGDSMATRSRPDEKTLTSTLQNGTVDGVKEEVAEWEAPSHDGLVMH
jgi:hypothetical protein